jgi:ankyrin repeat protein
MCAVKMNTCLLVQLLLEAGADVEAEDLASCTPLKYAAAAAALETGQLLVSRVRTGSPTLWALPVGAERRVPCAVCRVSCAVCRVPCAVCAWQGADVNNCRTDPQRLLSPIARLRRGRDPHSAQRADEFIAVLLNVRKPKHSFFCPHTPIRFFNAGVPDDRVGGEYLRRSMRCKANGYAHTCTF